MTRISINSLVRTERPCGGVLATRIQLAGFRQNKARNFDRGFVDLVKRYTDLQIPEVTLVSVAEDVGSTPLIRNFIQATCSCSHCQKTPRGVGDSELEFYKSKSRTLTLSPQELNELTDYKHTRKQREALDHMEVPHLITPEGKVKVLRDDLFRRQQIGSTHKQMEPNFGALRST